MNGIGWAMIMLAGLLEIIWATALKESNGFTRLWPSILSVTVAFASFIVLAFALRHLPVGTAYAVWVGIGAAGVAIVGVVHFGDTPTPLRLLCVALIVVGVIGLRALDASP